MPPMDTFQPKDKKPAGKWTETCIGLWSRTVLESSSASTTTSSSSSSNKQQQQQTPMCMGINLVHVKVCFFLLFISWSKTRLSAAQRSSKYYTILTRCYNQ